MFQQFENNSLTSGIQKGDLFTFDKPHPPATVHSDAPDFSNSGTSVNTTLAILWEYPRLKLSIYKD